MELEYMLKLKEWDEKKGWKKTGVEEDDIKLKESKYELFFPKSYKEYLIITGLYSPIGLRYRFEYADKHQQDAQKWLKEYDLENLIKKPFWVIATDGDSESFWYFHLDEGDNPAIYRLSCMYYGEVKDKLAFGKVADSFQAWIEKAIDYFEEDPENQ